MNVNDIDSLSDEQVRDILTKIIERLELAEADGIFGNDSWQGFLEIEE